MHTTLLIKKKKKKKKATNSTNFEYGMVEQNPYLVDENVIEIKGTMTTNR
jgi:hypothetical protein